jgi:predicted transcriptional regulator
MANILSIAATGKTKTCILHKCNLSYRQLQAYLDLLLDKQLLRMELHESRSNPEKVFITTEKGRAFLRTYEKLRATMERKKTKLTFK